MKQALSQYINKPDVVVEVIQVNSKKYTIQGLVNRPGPYPLVVPTKVFDALGSAGGFRDFANKKRHRDFARRPKRLKFNLTTSSKGKEGGPKRFCSKMGHDTILVK